MCIPENMFAMQNGVDGINYEGVDENGLPLNAKPTDQVPDEYKMHVGDVVFISNGYNFGDDAKNAAYVARSFPGYEEMVAKSVLYSNSDAWTQISFTVPIEAATDYSGAVMLKQNELIAQAISCDPAEFDTVWDTYIKAINDAGAQKVIEAYRQAYKDGNWRGSFPAY
jgi:putative aldouronate transport system substrate-binding protein